MECLICDHCRWQGTPADLHPHPEDDAGGVCPKCWAKGWVTYPRRKLEGLLEALNDDPPSPRFRKRLIDMDERELDEAIRTAKFRQLHQDSPVLLKTKIKGSFQVGLDFMREEFRIKEES